MAVENYWSTLREGEEDVVHVRLLGAGGFGEVHEVSSATRD